MKAVYKYPLPSPMQSLQVQMPEGARIVGGGIQDGEYRLWAQVDTDTCKLETRVFMLVATGVPVPDHAVYVGTIFDDEQATYVWHVYEDVRT